MKIHKEFFRYVIPSMLAFALSGIYAIADGFFVGNALGDNALAAINMAYPLTAFLQAVGTGIGMGGAVSYTISIGNKNEKRGNQFFGMSLILLVLAGILLTVLFLLGAPAVLHLFGATGEIETLGKEYLLYISYGAIFQVLGTGLVPFIRNMGSSVTAMAAMVVGFLTNIFLDYLFVWVLPWGMMGAAVATVIGQAMTFLVCVLFFIWKKARPCFQFEKQQCFFTKHVLSVALSPFGLTFSPNITLILVNKSAALFGGTMAVTCYSTVSYISCVVMLLLQGVSDGSQPLVSLAYGEGDLPRAKAVRNLGYQFAGVVSAICMAVLFFTRENAAKIFGASPQVTQEVARILPIFIVGFLFVSISRVTTAFFYAVNQNVRAYLLIYGEPLLLLLLLLVLPAAIGIQGTWLAVPISQIVTAAASLLLIWKEKQHTTKTALTDSQNS